ncbi:hypothetical protein BD410DRAFT_483821 [Rickenella mellea]|uniref:Ubinuclein middle domain-containing protein n=1 Tax=Rickenella mellea TaxID=50990 RepID=A0A4Y7QJS0_9AGAM|nr:hypothetical protein BD410DRAFT_483821 [Rickenella mellea]
MSQTLSKGVVDDDVHPSDPSSSRPTSSGDHSVAMNVDVDAGPSSPGPSTSASSTSSKSARVAAPASRAAENAQRNGADSLKHKPNTTTSATSSSHTSPLPILVDSDAEAASSSTNRTSPKLANIVHGAADHDRRDRGKLPNGDTSANPVVSFDSRPGSSRLSPAPVDDDVKPFANGVKPKSRVRVASNADGNESSASAPPLSATDVTDHALSPAPMDVDGTEAKHSSSLAVPADTSKAKPKSKAGAKPKSTKARSPSPSPPPVPPPPQLKTIRLDIRLGGPDNYEVDISKLAKNTGQRPPTPPPVKRDTSSSEDEAEEKEGEKKKGKGKAGRKNAASEYYDLNDPFIDDSDLAIDERTFFAQTKQQGFYVSSGEVALLKDKSAPSPAKKPKSKKVPPIPTIIPLAGSHAVNSASHGGGARTGHASPTTGKDGSRESPIALMSDGEGEEMGANGVSLKRKASADGSSQSGGAKKKRKAIDVESFSPELQGALQELKTAIAKESFEQKGKFPPSLKPVLAQVALKAIRTGEYNDNFFSLMPKLFIYNKFTMTKLIKRTVYPEHQQMLIERQEELLEELKARADEGFAKAQEEHEKSVAGWERKQEREKTKAAGLTSTEGTPHPDAATLHPDAAVPAAKPDDAESVDADKDKEAAGKEKDGAGKESHPPAKKYRLSERMKAIIWELVVLSNESCRIENEKNALEGSTVQVSEQGSRKLLYQKIVAAFPDGWMSSGQISRDVSVMKKRYEAQQADEQQQQQS